MSNEIILPRIMIKFLSEMVIKGGFLVQDQT